MRDICSSYKAGNLDEAEYQIHCIKKDRARKEKEEDKKKAANGEFILLTMDLKAVKIPRFTESASGEETIIKLLNFGSLTLTDIHTKNTFISYKNANLIKNEAKRKTKHNEIPEELVKDKVLPEEAAGLAKWFEKYYVSGRMEASNYFLDKLKEYGVGRRKLDDVLFINEKPPPRLGVYDFDEENLCHEVIQSTCNIPGCDFTSESLLEYENHYNTSHRYTCARCKKILPSPHLLDLHVQENHDSFFAVQAERKPSYCCFIEECKLKFMTANDRRQHCIEVHKLPKEFRFDTKPKSKNKKKTKPSTDENAMSMEVVNESTSEAKNNLVLSTSKHKTFAKYCGKKFTKNDGNKKTKDVNMDEAMADLKESLPE